MNGAWACYDVDGAIWRLVSQLCLPPAERRRKSSYGAETSAIPAVLSPPYRAYYVYTCSACCFIVPIRVRLTDSTKYSSAPTLTQSSRSFPLVTTVSAARFEPPLNCKGVERIRTTSHSLIRSPRSSTNFFITYNENSARYWQVLCARTVLNEESITKTLSCSFSVILTVLLDAFIPSQYDSCHIVDIPGPRSFTHVVLLSYTLVKMRVKSTWRYVKVLFYIRTHCMNGVFG